MGPTLHLRWRRSRECGYRAELDLLLPLGRGDIRRMREKGPNVPIGRFPFKGDLPESKEAKPNRKIPFARAAELGINLSRSYLEIRWERKIMDGDEWIVPYELVAAMNGGVVRASLGGTRVGSAKEPLSVGPNVPEILVDTPFRDGAHARWDALALGIRAYAVYGTYRTDIQPMPAEKLKEVAELAAP